MSNSLYNAAVFTLFSIHTPRQSPDFNAAAQPARPRRRKKSCNNLPNRFEFLAGIANIALRKPNFAQQMSTRILHCSNTLPKNRCCPENRAVRATRRNAGAPGGRPWAGRILFMVWDWWLGMLGAVRAAWGWRMWILRLRGMGWLDWKIQEIIRAGGGCRGKYFYLGGLYLKTYFK
jgi:hypothetical protein